MRTLFLEWPWSRNIIRFNVRGLSPLEYVESLKPVFQASFCMVSVDCHKIYDSEGIALISC